MDVSETPEIETEFYEPISLWKRRAINYMALINSGGIIFVEITGNQYVFF